MHTLLELSKFKGRSFHEPNLIPRSTQMISHSTVDSDVELNYSDSIHFHDVQWSKTLTSEINFSNLCIRFGI